MDKSNLNPCLFLDRDGVINYDYGHVYKIEDIRFMPNIFELVRTANALNILVIVVTNQAGIGKGFYNEVDFSILMNWMRTQFIERNCFLDGIYYCPFHEEAKINKYKKESLDRKPNSGMLFKASVDYSIDLNNSMIIGDNISDMIAGKGANLRYNLLLNNREVDDYFINIASLKEALYFLKKLII